MYWQHLVGKSGMRFTWRDHCEEGGNGEGDTSNLPTLSNLISRDSGIHRPVKRVRPITSPQ